MAVEKMVPEKQINEFVTELRRAAGQNLDAVILYGSAAGGEFHAGFSDVNLLCLLREISFANLAALTPAVERWTRKHPAPLLMTRQEVERSADVFAIEWLDMKQHHRALFGEDVLQGLTVSMHLHRAQVEYELREKLLLLRQQVLQAANHKQRLWELLLQGLPSFTTLFRHALIALGRPAPNSKRETLQFLAQRIEFDPSSFAQLLDIREGHLKREIVDVKDLCGRVLVAVEQVTAAVDTMLDSARPDSGAPRSE